MFDKTLISGLQHIGLPTGDFEGTIAFYRQLGFEVLWQRPEGPDRVAFLRCGNCVIETYPVDSPAGCNGAVDHIALDVTDIERAYREARALGYTALEGGIVDLGVLEHGVRYFTILGVNHEKIEFNQILTAEGAERNA